MAGFGLALFGFGEDTVAETVAEAGERDLDPFDIGQIGADAQDHSLFPICHHSLGERRT